MDTLTFIAEIVGHLAWPVTAVIIFLILRRPLLRLFPTIQRLRFHDIEMDFGQQIHALAVEARTKLPAVSPDQQGESSLHGQWYELAQQSPRAVVLETWLKLEEAAIEAVRRHGIQMKSIELRSPIILGQAMEESGILEGETPAIYHQLRNLRNAAAHASHLDLSAEAAIEYADLAGRLTEYLRRA